MKNQDINNINRRVRDLYHVLEGGSFCLVSIFLFFLSVSAFSEQLDTIGNEQFVPDHSDRTEEVIAICKTHFDIGYTKRVKDILAYYRGSMITRALDIVDQSKNLPAEQQFIWVSPGWVMQKIIESGNDQSPELKKRLDNAIKSGRFITHALPFTLEADCLDVEPMARGYMFSDKVTQQYGLPLSRSAKTTDVPSEPGALATVLARGDVRFIHIGCNWPSCYVQDLPPLFWWEGPDKSRILCMYSPIYSSSTAFNPWGQSEGSPGKIAPNIGVNFMPPRDWPYKTWPAILVTADNQGPPSGQDISSLFREAKEKMPWLRVRMGSMDEFADAILKENPLIPVVNKEMPDTWIHGVMSDPRGIAQMRQVGLMLPAYEMLHTQLSWGWGMESQQNITEQVDKAFELYLLYGEHTWGNSQAVDVYGEQFQQTPRDTWKELEGSWEDKSNYIAEASSMTENIRNDALECLRESLGVSVDNLLVFNPLPWKRSGEVETDGEIFYVEDIPDSGYKVVSLVVPNECSSISKGMLKTGDGILENDYYRIVVDPSSGVMSSFYDKKLKREWLSKDTGSYPGLYMNERFEKRQIDNWCLTYQQGRMGDQLHRGMSKPGLPANIPYRQAIARRGKVEISRSGDYGEINISYPADLDSLMPASELTVRLGKFNSYVDFKVTIKDKPRDNWPEADWAVFPFRIENPSFTVSRPLGYMDPSTDIAKGANRMMYSTGGGVLIRNPKGEGIVVLPLDHPLISLGTPGIWKFSMDYIPRDPIVYVNLYNNMWNTNFRYWYTGSWSSRIRVWSVSEEIDTDKALTIPSLEARMPLQACRGTLKDASSRGIEGQSGILVSQPGVIVTAFGRNSLSDQLILRLWNMNRTEKNTLVSLPGNKNVSQVIPINLRGEVLGDPLPVRDQKFHINIPGFSPVSFIVR